MGLELPVYLDNNATTPVDPGVLEAMLPYFTRLYGNTAVRHYAQGRMATDAVERAREQVSGLIGAEPGEIIFTSGATEAVNLALKGVYEMYASRGNHIITAATEHKAVLDTCRYLETKGAAVTVLPVDRYGHINLARLSEAITDKTILICLMYANNETGVLHPVSGISAIARQHRVLFFTDATQATGKIPVNITTDGIDLLAFSAHKMYGPKGVGALYIRRKNPRVRIVSQLHGGGHEHSLRSGTLNVPGIVGFGEACVRCAKDMDTAYRRMAVLRDRLETALLTPGTTTINGDPTQRLPHVTNLFFRYPEGLALMADVAGKVALSGGSACSALSGTPSYVLKAMGADDDAARNALRFSLGRFTTAEEIDYSIQVLREATARLKTGYPSHVSS